MRIDHRTPLAHDLHRSLGTGTLISIVIPCYNEQDVLPLLYERFTHAARSWTTPYEVILVDDGSCDRTWEVMQDIHRRDPRWKMLGLARNFGHQTALWAGLHVAAGRVIAVLDADLQDPPEILPEFFRKWEEGYDVVYAVRQHRKEGLLKRLAYAGFYRLLSLLSDVDIPLDSGDFCVMDRRVLEVLKTMPERNRFIRGLRAWVGFRQTALPYERKERAAGEVKYTFRKLMRLALDGLLSFSTHPLRLATYCGIAVSALSFLMVCFTLLQRVFAEQFARWGFVKVPGFATIVISIFFLGGVQLLCLGILGEYLGRVFEDVKRRPMWTSRAALGVVDPLAHAPGATHPEVGPEIAPTPPERNVPEFDSARRSIT